MSENDWFLVLCILVFFGWGGLLRKYLKENDLTQSTTGNSIVVLFLCGIVVICGIFIVGFTVDKVIEYYKL